MSQTLSLYRDFLETIPDAALVVDQEGWIVCANTHMNQLFHAPDPGLTGAAMDQLIPERIRTGHGDHFKRYWQAPARRSMGAGGTFSALRCDGSEFPVDIMLTPLTLDEFSYVLCVIRDRTTTWELERDLRQALAREQQLALTDSLTGVGNLRHLLILLQREIDNVARHERPFTLIYFDLDDFKQVNDEWGHAEGDRMLCAVADRIDRELRRGDLLARLGGDEFAILMPDTRLGDVQQRIVEFLEQLRGALITEGWPVSLSTGVVTFDQPPESPETALSVVDKLMYKVKKAGKSHALFGTFSELENPLAEEPSS